MRPTSVSAFADLKPGDAVIVRHPERNARPYSVAAVRSVRGDVVKVGPHWFWRDDGTAAGPDRSHLVVPTPAALAQLDRQVRDEADHAAK